MKNLLRGFQQFILRGNVVDLAVGIVIGAGFTAVINALVKDLLTPFIAALIKQPNFSGMAFTLNGSQFMYGEFINALISFILTAAAVYFFVIAPLNTLINRIHSGAPAPDPTTKKCPECLSEIPLAAKRCAHCAQVVA
ncbi:MAG TPA: large conductance mechanosensitive channel protein MscL [Candidatus Paceibacterota bacterium]